MAYLQRKDTLQSIALTASPHHFTVTTEALDARNFEVVTAGSVAYRPVWC